VRLEAVEALESEARLVLEHRQDAERLRERPLLVGERTEGLVGVRDRARELLVSLAEGVEDRARVSDQSLKRGLLGAQDPQNVRRGSEERPEVAEGVVQVHAPPIDGDRGTRLRPLDRLARPRVEATAYRADLRGVLGL